MSINVRTINDCYRSVPFDNLLLEFSYLNFTTVILLGAWLKGTCVFLSSLNSVKILQFLTSAEGESIHQSIPDIIIHGYYPKFSRFYFAQNSMDAYINCLVCHIVTLHYDCCYFNFFSYSLWVVILFILSMTYIIYHLNLCNHEAYVAS